MSGGWDYSSGCDVASHFIGGAVVVARPGEAPVDTRWVAMRRDQYEIIDNWNTLGMRGTGSRRVVVESGSTLSGQVGDREVEPVRARR